METKRNPRRVSDDYYPIQKKNERKRAIMAART